MRGVGDLLSVVLAAGWLLYLLQGVVRTALIRRCREAERAWMQRSAEILVVALIEGEEELALPRCTTLRREELLCELVATLLGAAYGLNPRPLGRMLIAEGVDRWLVRRLHRARGLERARLLKWASELPTLPRVAALAEGYRLDPMREVRFAALLVEMAADPARLLHAVVRYEVPLTPVEVDEVLALLRRSLLPIAYRPLLATENENLQRIALALVAHFAIEEAEPALHHLLRAERTEEALRALRLLVLLHRPLPKRLVVPLLGRVTPQERLRLLRLMVREGVAAEQVRRLFQGEESAYYTRLACTYKRTLHAH